MRRWLVVLLAGECFSAEKAPTQYKVDISHERGSFSGTLSLKVDGPSNNSKLTWLATIKNDSIHTVHRAEFCVTVTGRNGEPLPVGQECALRLWANNWASGAPMTFKGSQRVTLSVSKEPATITAAKVNATEVYDKPPNVRVMTARCSLLWAPAVKAFGDRKFRPLVLDKETLTATFAFDGGDASGLGTSSSIKAYTTASTAFFGPTWERFRVDSASLYLQDGPTGTCRAEMKVAFSGLAKALMSSTYQWYMLESNFALERIVLGQLEDAAKTAAVADRFKGIAEIGSKPAVAPPSDIATQMEALAKMFNAGLLTAEEFALAKKKLLGQ